MKMQNTLAILLLGSVSVSISGVRFFDRANNVGTAKVVVHAGAR
jgi:NADH:ubiquinone oxidoreductase subunit 6 (subunit J)